VKFKLDENLPIEICGLFNSAGHNAVTAIEEGLAGKSDSKIVETCSQEDRVLVTLDVGFAGSFNLSKGLVRGIMLLGLRRADKNSVSRAIQSALGLLASEDISGRVWIVEDSQIRISDG